MCYYWNKIKNLILQKDTSQENKFFYAIVSYQKKRCPERRIELKKLFLTKEIFIKDYSLSFLIVKKSREVFYFENLLCKSIFLSAYWRSINVSPEPLQADG